MSTGYFIDLIERSLYRGRRRGVLPVTMNDRPLAPPRSEPAAQHVARQVAMLGIAPEPSQCAVGFWISAAITLLLLCLTTFSWVFLI